MWIFRSVESKLAQLRIRKSWYCAKKLLHDCCKLLGIPSCIVWVHASSYRWQLLKSGNLAACEVNLHWNDGWNCIDAVCQPPVRWLLWLRGAHWGGRRQAWSENARIRSFRVCKSTIKFPLSTDIGPQITRHMHESVSFYGGYKQSSAHWLSNHLLSKGPW